MSKRYLVKQNARPLAASKYNTSYVEITRNLRMMNLNDMEIAKVIGVCIDTYRSWLTQHDELRMAYLDGGLLPDAMVLGKMFEMCIGGGEVTETKEVIDWESGTKEELVTTKELAPSFQAAKWWLEARSRLIQSNIDAVSTQEGDKGPEEQATMSEDDMKKLLAETRRNIKRRVE